MKTLFDRIWLSIREPAEFYSIGIREASTSEGLAAAALGAIFAEVLRSIHLFLSPEVAAQQSEMIASVLRELSQAKGLDLNIIFERFSSGLPSAQPWIMSVGGLAWAPIQAIIGVLSSALFLEFGLKILSRHRAKYAEVVRLLGFVYFSLCIGGFFSFISIPLGQLVGWLVVQLLAVYATSKYFDLRTGKAVAVFIVPQMVLWGFLCCCCGGTMGGLAIALKGLTH
jgi:hypothetical protein